MITEAITLLRYLLFVGLEDLNLEILDVLAESDGNCVLLLRTFTANYLITVREYLADDVRLIARTYEKLVAGITGVNELGDKINRSGNDND